MLNLKSKLLFLLVVPILFIVILSYVVLSDIDNNKRNLELTKTNLLEAQAISKVVHFMQIERGITSGLIAGNNKNKKDDALVLSRENLDKSIYDAKSLYKQYKTDNNQHILKILDEMQLNRKEFDLTDISALDAREFYTRNISTLLNFIKTIPSTMYDRENRNFMQSYSYLSSAKEELGQIRAILLEVFTINKFSDETFISLKEHLTIHIADTNNFKTISPNILIDIYNNTFRGEHVEDTFKIIDNALRNKNSTDFHIKPSYWFEKSTKSINLLKDIEDKLFEMVITSINQKLDSIFYKITAITFFLLFTVLALVFLMTLIIRKILSSTNTLEQEYSNSISLLEQYKSTVDRSFIVSKTDPRGIITYVNDEFCNVSGYQKEELIGKPHNKVRHPDTPKETFKSIWHTIKDLKQPWFGEIKNLKKDGSVYWVQAIINPILDQNKEVVEFIAIRTDITQQKEMSEYFQNQLKITVGNFNCSMHLTKEYEKAIDLSTILSRTDVKGNITYVNDKFLEITGYTSDELIGRNHSVLSSKDTNKKIYKNLWKTISSGNIWQGVMKNNTKSGTDFWTKTTIIPIKNLNGEIAEFLAIRHDVTTIMKQREKFEEIAKTDSLTGCGNRFRLNNDMRELKNLSLAVFNIDGFRQINDFFGHQFGDLIIVSIANKIYKHISIDSDNLRFYRLQGDEFVVLAINYPKELFILKAKDILDLVKERIVVKEEEIAISYSCGISFEDKEYLLSSANMALKVAKKNNVDYVIYDESISLNHEYENNIYWAKKLSDAIENNNIVSYFQPIINNSNLAYEKYECLVRIIDNDKVISPFFFLDVAKQTRQYFSITKAVINQAFEKFKDLENEFSINLSIKDILNQQISEYILDMLQKYGIGSRVVFEIVESESIENFEGVINFINLVKKHNCKIAIDDFGTGYSNFEYLIKLQADYLKIDGSLIKHINSDKNTFMVVSTIVDFSKKLGMKTIAEFVENEDIFKTVKDLGIDYSQGYHFSAPKSEI